MKKLFRSMMAFEEAAGVDLEESKKMLLEIPGKSLRVNGLEINHLLVEWFHRY